MRVILGLEKFLRSPFNRLSQVLCRVRLTHHDFKVSEDLKDSRPLGAPGI